MILNEPFNKELLNNFLKDFLPDYQLDERSVRTPDKSILTEVTQLGVSRKAEVTVLEAECEETDTNKRIAITQAAFKVLRDHGIRNAIIAFHDGADQWRLSLLTSTLEIKGGKVIKKDSNPRRYSYLLGVGAKTVTPYRYLVEKGRVDDIKQLQERFSVEVVNKQFYASIADLFTKLVGGERGATKHPGLLKINGVISQNVEHQEFAVRLIGRIIFSWFLKEKRSAAGVPIVPNELLSLDAVASNADYYHSILEPLFFELLNKRVEYRHESLREAPFSTVPYLNGGLFSPQRSDFYNQNSFNGAGTPGLTYIPDSWFTELFTMLEQYNFTVDENTSYDVDLSIDPEMLGRIFENLLAEINPETGESARKSTGSFYTPREIVDYMVDSSLLEFLKNKTGTDEAKLKALISWGQTDDDKHPLTDSEKQKIVNALAGLTILDPACGSGAFPIGILQKVVYILQQADPRAEVWLENQLKSIASPELKRDIQEKYESENYDWLRKYGVIRETIFGVDIQTIATEISKLRCFLTLIIEEEVDDNKPNRGVHALPNLDFKFVTANSLIGLPDSNANAKSKGLNLFEDVSNIEQLKNIRNQYFGANADERARLQVEFKNLQMDMLRSRIATSGATSDLYNTLSDWDPFSHKATEWFDAEWMFGLEGFDIVIANPPYVGERSHKKTFDKLKSTNLGGRFYLGKMDLYYFFFHLALDVCKPYGSVTFITTNSYFRSLGGKKLRDDISSRSYIQELVDFNGIKIFDTADNYTVITKLKKKNIVDAPRDEQCRVVVANHNGSVDSTTLQSIINGADRESEYSLRNQETLFIGDDLQIETLSNTEMSSIYEKISSHNKISHNFKVSAGVQTGADKVTAQHKKLLGDRVKQGDGILVLKLTEIESLISKGSQIPNYFKPWYLNPDVGRWSPSVITSNRVAYFDRSFLERNIDDAYLDYLKRFQPVLNKRREAANNVIEWWQLQWPRSSSIFTEPKVICCKWSARNDFAYTDLEWYSSVNVTYISNMKFSDTAYLKYLTGVLNSKLYYLWFYNKSKRAGNRLLLDPKPVMETPLMIPKSIDTVNTVANLVDEIIKLKATKPIVDTSALESQIDQLVYQLYDLTPEEIAIVEGS